MSMTQQSKKTGSIQWLMVRISGVVLLFLLLAHFWVHHFFIKDFYGKVNVVDIKMDQKTLMDYNPMWGKRSGEYVDSLHMDLKGTDYYLRASNVKGPTPVTVIKDSKRIEILKGNLQPETIQNVLGHSVSNQDLIHETISPKQIKTKRMINYEDVHARVGGGGWIWWKTYNLLFLVLALYHGLMGMWDVIADYKMSPMTRMTLYGGINTLGLVLFILGVLIIVPM